PATTADGDLLSGHKTLVVDGDLADVLVVSAQVGGVPGLFCVRADAEGVTVRRQQMLDPTRGSAEVWFDGAAATRLDVSDRTATVVGDVLDRARIALAAEQVGGAAHCLETAVEHVKAREQFGRPIGSFQAVKHKCARVLYDLEAARCAAWYAAWAVEEAPEELPMVVPTVKYLCSEAFQTAARDCVHLLGGIGFTWEHPAHLYLKRATTAAQFLGSPTDSLHRLADTMFDAP
ncbi:MAG: acyl-CoA dehydrogenase family protein, partial [Nocardioidaceae bacterium]